jgi:hypothetical protein
MRRYLMTEKQLRAGWYYLESLHRPRFYQKDALLRAGYAPSTARVPAYAVRRIMGLRESVRILADLRGDSLRLPPPTKRYPRREALKSILDSADPRLPGMDNKQVAALHRNAMNAERIAQGLPVRPVRCLVCGGRLEGVDNWCPGCQRCQC